MLGSRVRKYFLKLFVLLFVVKYLDRSECQILTKISGSQTEVPKDVADYKIRIYFTHQAVKQGQNMFNGMDNMSECQMNFFRLLQRINESRVF
jgi:hypothetical protein